MLANVQRENRDYAALQHAVQGASPDVLVLEEVTDAWLQGVASFEQQYPHTFLLPREGYHGIAIYSRYPLRNPHVLELG